VKDTVEVAKDGVKDTVEAAKDGVKDTIADMPCPFAYLWQ